MILHIDCNTFYASCEVSLRPDLKGKPVVVANCNEAGGGIILALTKEAKALGLKRGNPVFQVKDVLERNNVAIFPANLPKYVDISRRLMQVVKEQDIVLNFTKYSVDEFFGELPLDNPAELALYARKVKEHIEHCTGIPVSCGISLSYTLAKVATWFSKHYTGYNGVCVLTEKNIETALGLLPVADIWGIGRRTAPKMQSYGINTALDYYNKPDYWIQKHFKVNGHRTWKELHGIPCIDIESPVQQKSIMHSRTFTYMTQELSVLESYIADYAVAAARKLRDQHSVCLAVTTFIATNPHRDDLEQYDNSATIKLSVACADTLTITNAALDALRQVFRPYMQYKRAGVILSDITSDDAIQLDLFAEPTLSLGKSRALMEATDKINNKYGMNTIHLGVQESDKEVTQLPLNFQPFKSPTTNFEDIIEVK